jgi:alpha-tubulin suppressor-like RCC1 family protein
MRQVATAWFVALFGLGPAWAEGLLGGGYGHRVWVDGGGRVWVQGSNLHGQLGNAGILYEDTPQHPLGMVDVVQVASGLDHILALKNDGTLWGWGYGDVGQVGATFRTVQILDSLGIDVLALYTAERQPVRVTVPPLVQVAAGARFSLALARNGTVWVWGANGSAQLGLGDPIDRYLPAQIHGFTGVAHLAAGYVHSLAIDGEGKLYAWGDNRFGQLGDGTTQQRSKPIRVPGLPPMQAMAGGEAFTMAIDQTGQLWTWGNNQFGQLGDGTTSPRLTPAPVTGETNVMAVAAGRAHALALHRDGSVWAWGANESGQLGQGDTSRRPVPVLVSGLPLVAAIACGDGFSMAMGADGMLYAWGDNRYLQLGPQGRAMEMMWLQPRATVTENEEQVKMGGLR